MLIIDDDLEQNFWNRNPHFRNRIECTKMIIKIGKKSKFFHLIFPLLLLYIDIRKITLFKQVKINSFYIFKIFRVGIFHTGPHSLSIVNYEKFHSIFIYLFIFQFCLLIICLILVFCHNILISEWTISTTPWTISTSTEETWASAAIVRVRSTISWPLRDVGALGRHHWWYQRFHDYGRFRELLAVLI